MGGGRLKKFVVEWAGSHHGTHEITTWLLTGGSQEYWDRMREGWRLQRKRSGGSHSCSSSDSNLVPPGSNQPSGNPAHDPGGPINRRGSVILGGGVQPSGPGNSYGQLGGGGQSGNSLLGPGSLGQQLIGPKLGGQQGYNPSGNLKISAGQGISLSRGQSGFSIQGNNIKNAKTINPTMKKNPSQKGSDLSRGKSMAAPTNRQATGNWKIGNQQRTQYQGMNAPINMQKGSGSGWSMQAPSDTGPVFTRPGTFITIPSQNFEDGLERKPGSKFYRHSQNTVLDREFGDPARTYVEGMEPDENGQKALDAIEKKIALWIEKINMEEEKKRKQEKEENSLKK